MSTSATPEKPTPPGCVPPSKEVTVFLKPSFGITVQSGTLCASVSVKPQAVDTPAVPGTRAVDESTRAP